MVQGLQERYDRARSVVFLSFDQLTVQESEELRRKVEEGGGEYIVAKKTLLDKALADKKIKDYSSAADMEGKLATVFGYTDEVSPAKTVADFRRRNPDKVSFAGGILDGCFLEASKVEALSQIPDKQELYAKLVGSLNAPISGFANVLAGNMRSLVYVLKAVEEKKV